MEKEEIYWSNTNSEDDSKGVVFGLEGNLFAPILISIITGFCLVFFCLLLKVPFILILFISLSPPALTFLFLFLFVSNKPPHYAEDCIDYVITGGCASPRPVSPADDLAAFINSNNREGGNG